MAKSAIDSEKSPQSANPTDLITSGSSASDSLRSRDSVVEIGHSTNTPATPVSEEKTDIVELGDADNVESDSFLNDNTGKSENVSGGFSDISVLTRPVASDNDTEISTKIGTENSAKTVDGEDQLRLIDSGNVDLDNSDTVGDSQAVDTKSAFTEVTLETQKTQEKDQPSAFTETPQSSEITDSAPAQQPTEEEENPVLAQFMSACQNGDLATVTDLISSGKVDSSDTFSQGITGLHWAAINNRLTVVKYLMENPHSKADPNKLGGSLAASPLHWACRNGLVYVVDYLLSHTDADPTLKDSQQYNALHLAVHSSNITLVLYILLKCVVIDKALYIDTPDNIQCTALHWAAYQGDILTVKALLNYGADVSKVDQTLMTPLHWGFIRGYKSVLAALVEAGSDIFHKNDKNKDSFGVASDMNCEGTWLQVLKEDDRNAKHNWSKNTHVISAKTAKLTTFFTPYVTLPIALNICSFGEGYAIPKLFFSAAIFAASILFLQKLVIPTYIRTDKPLFQTPYLAGLFSATANWAILSWVFVIFPKVWLKQFFTSVALSVVIVALSYSFFKAMTINPGNVPVPTDPKIVFDDIKELVSLGKFDTEHFCVNTFTRKPLRSKFSRTSNALVARFDHYCPWVYNDIGVRNHKLFMTFVYSLSVAIILYSVLAIEYFDVYADDMGYSSDVEDSCWLLSEELCVGYTHRHFIFNLMFWCWVQGIWIMFLCVVQTFQICKGLTTWELSSLDKKMSSPTYNHSTVPGDFLGADAQNQSPPSSHSHRHKNGFSTCMKLLGINQFSMTVKVGSLSLLRSTTHNEHYTSIESFDIPTDFGWKQNWLDFWFIGEIEWRNLFFLPIYGENNLNGRVVDYYKLYEYPSKVTGADAV